MVGVFACPECGLEVELEGLSPGRQIQCEGCSTWVEVPFLPRASGWKRSRFPRRRSAWESRLLRASAIFAAVVVLGLLGAGMIRGRVRTDHERVLAELIESADRAEGEHRPDRALIEIEGALIEARKFDPAGSERLSRLRERRDRLSVLDIQTRLAKVERMTPDGAVGEAATLAERVRTDPALSSMADTVEATLEKSRLRQAEADLEIARRAFDQGRSADSFAAADRLHRRASKLSEADARRFRDQARSLIESVVGRDGVAIDPVSGKFALGSAEDYTARMDRIWTEALKARGYLPQPRVSPWRSVWDERAPNRASSTLVETQEGYYLQSMNRTTQVDATFELSLPGRAPWSNRVVAATRTPLPDLPAYLAGHLATAGKRAPEAERRLHDDALKLFFEQASRVLRSIPAAPPR